MALSNIRTGTATSSTIMPLISKGKGVKPTIGSPFFTYLKECRYERSLLQNLETEVDTFSMEWGKLCELYLHTEILAIGYRFNADQTVKHPDYEGWVGSPDGEKVRVRLGREIIDTITDSKCPTSKKAFCDLVFELYDYDGAGGVTPKEKPNMERAVEYFRSNAQAGEKYYWQLVSNSCIRKSKYAELIVFMPFKERVNEILEYNEGRIGAKLGKKDPRPFMMISTAKPNKYPFLLKESGYNELNIIRFEVPEEDKIFLTERFIIFDKAVNMDSKEYNDFIKKCKSVKYNEELIKIYLSECA